MDYVKDKYGNEIHYSRGGGIHTKAKDGNEVDYLLSDYDKFKYDEKGNLALYDDKNKVILSVDDKGDLVHHQKNEIIYTVDKEGNKVHYTDGIRDNILAENRKKLATTF